MRRYVVDNRLACAESFSKDDAWTFRCKVYSILLAQLIIILAAVWLIVLIEPVHDYVVTHGEVFWLLLICLVLLLVCMFGCIDLIRLNPASHILFFVLTLALCLFIGVCACFTDVIMVALAIFVAIIVVACLAILAVQTIIDFSILAGVVIVSVVLLFACMTIGILRPSSVFLMIPCYLGGLILCLYLLYDVRLMVGAQHKYAFENDEYLFGTLMLYLDIFHICSYMLSCCGLAENDE